MGVRDRKLSGKLMTEKLDLKKAVDICKTKDTVKTQSREIQGEGPAESSVDRISAKKNHNSKKNTPQKGKKDHNDKPCGRCGLGIKRQNVR